MKWTRDAESVMREYCDARFKNVGSGEIDREEVESDVRLHVEEEHGSKGTGVVTEESLRRVLAQMGGGEEEISGLLSGGSKAVWAR